MTSSATLVSTAKCFDGQASLYQHSSTALKCNMRFRVFLPSTASESSPLKWPVLYFLSGLSCTENNFFEKAGALRVAAELGVVIVCPDTSPRGVDIEGDSDSWDFGKGAGFYVDATADKWADNYNMYQYVVHELPLVIGQIVNVDESRVGIFGHSMVRWLLSSSKNNTDHWFSGWPWSSSDRLAKS